MMKRLIPLLVLALAAGCSSKDSELDSFIAQTKLEQPGGVDPLPVVKPYDTYTYTAQYLRSPFTAGGSGNSGASGLRPDNNRNREILEGFALDTLKMVGTMKIGGKYYGLVRAPDSLVRRVLPGQYMGQSEGQITRVEPSRISITEIIPDGVGGFIERAAGLALDE